MRYRIETPFFSHIESDNPRAAVHVDVLDIARHRDEVRQFHE
jgi:hypothetical protein